MSIESITRAIQFILAPVVMVTSCAILAGGMLTLYNDLNERLRTLTRERLDLLRAPGGGFDLDGVQADAFKMERLREIDMQTPGLLDRHTLIHRSLLALYLAIVIFILSMLAIAAAVIAPTAAMATLALVVFLVGACALLWSVLLVTIEIRTSNMAVRYEALRVRELGSPSSSSSASGV